MKQKARYTIVRVDNKCPQFLENKITSCIGRHICDKCDFGDTKEQFIAKIAQVLLKDELDWYRQYAEIIPNGKIDKPFCRNIYEHCLDKAKKIVEFLGVK